MLLMLLVSIGLLVLMGLGNNNRLGGWLQPRYTRTMDRLQQRQDARTARSVDSSWGRYAGYVGEAVVVAVLLLMFGAGQLIWPDEGSGSLGRILLLAIFLYAAYSMGKQSGRDRK